MIHFLRIGSESVIHKSVASFKNKSLKPRMRSSAESCALLGFHGCTMCLFKFFFHLKHKWIASAFLWIKTHFLQIFTLHDMLAWWIKRELLRAPQVGFTQKTCTEFWCDIFVVLAKLTGVYKFIPGFCALTSVSTVSRSKRTKRGWKNLILMPLLLPNRLTVHLSSSLLPLSGLGDQATEVIQ